MNLIISFAQVMVMSTSISKPTHLGGTVVKPLVQFNGVKLCTHIRHSLFCYLNNKLLYVASKRHILVFSWWLTNNNQMLPYMWCAIFFISQRLRVLNFECLCFVIFESQLSNNKIYSEIQTKMSVVRTCHLTLHLPQESQSGMSIVCKFKD